MLMLCYVLCLLFSDSKMAAMFYESLFSTAKLSFSPIGAVMAEEHVYLSLFPQCLWGEGRPLQTQLRCGH